MSATPSTCLAVPLLLVTHDAPGRTCSLGTLRRRSPARYASLRRQLPPRSCCASSARAAADADVGEMHTQLAFKALLQMQALREGTTLLGGERCLRRWSVLPH